MRKRREPISRRDFLKGAALAGGASVLAACTPAATPAAAPAATTAQAPAPTTAPSASGAKPKIVYWAATTYTTDADAEQDKQVNEWCAAHNVDVEINRMSSDERVPKWKTAFETKQFPDIGQLELNDAPLFAVSGVLSETSEAIGRLNKLGGGYTQGASADNKLPDGKYYTFPYFASTEVFYVRKDKLDAKGLALPETWDDVMKAAKAINDPQNNFWGWGQQLSTTSWDSEASLSPIMWSYGAKTWDEQGKPAIDSPETRTVLDFFKEGWKAGIFPADASTWDDSANNKAYLTGTVGMTQNTPSVLAAMEKDDKDLLGKSAITLLPKGPKGRFNSGYFYKMGVFKSSKNADVCLQLLEAILQPDKLRTIYDLSAGNMMPVFKDMLKDPMWNKSPQRQTVVQEVEFTVPQGYPGATQPWIQEAWQQHTVAKMFDRVLWEDWDNDKAIAEAKAALQKTYDDWQQKLK